MAPVVISTNEVKCFWPRGFVVRLYVKRHAARKTKAKYESICPCDSGHGPTNQFDERVAEPCCPCRIRFSPSATVVFPYLTTRYPETDTESVHDPGVGV